MLLNQGLRSSSSWYIGVTFDKQTRLHFESNKLNALKLYSHGGEFRVILACAEIAVNNRLL